VLPKVAWFLQKLIVAFDCSSFTISGRLKPVIAVVRDGVLKVTSIIDVKFFGGVNLAM
jgi:hypothetical protein